MKFTFIFAYLALFVAHTSAQTYCAGRPGIQLCIGDRDEGNNNRATCQERAMREMWWYNARINDCQKMKFLGCNGNRNRYCSLGSCRSRCKRP
ncbi:BPTI/Kunitz domain-containing protein-like [Drosophila miranda]|uniref:BPTI/Kunitz domain-containing protein-like n=1 Tax=Drosophila miranda TaxID=7229 RepID=UPI0007E67967|nr:BPTI/Kunitz domain-containing protein-like [Drosophila miranda]